MKKIFMQLAIDLAAQAIDEGTGGPFGAVIVQNGKVIGEGQNRVLARRDPTAHAEMVAIRNACETTNRFELKGCDIYTSCEPCPMCLGAVYWSRIERIYYAANRADAAAIGFDDNYFYTEIEKNKSERAVCMIELQREQAVAIFTQWQSMDNKQIY